MILTEQQEILIINLPETEYGRALFAWINQEIESLEHKIDLSGKICNDPIKDDFRVQMGIKMGLKRVLRKPQELIESKQKGVRK